MEPGPIPPHERAWRHPSELGPTPQQLRADTAASRHAKVLALGSGLAAVAVIGLVVVASTPPRSSGPVALNATTITPTERPVVAARTEPLLASFTPIPNEIAVAPALVTEPPEPADQVPDADAAVMVQTPEVTYFCTWGDVQWIEMPEGSIVLDEHGGLVAVSNGQELISAVD